MASDPILPLFVALFAAIVFAGPGFASGVDAPVTTSTGPGPAELPSTMLWAWEHPQDLRSIDPEDIGVAFLARTLRLGPGEMEIVPRRQPLQLPEGAVRIAVIRLEISAGVQADSAARGSVVAGVTELASLPGIAGIQIDFDATRSQREFYRDVLRDVRRRLPPDLLLSITALASWCMDDCWVSDLPVDEIVPMFFRMGPDDRHIRTILAEEGRPRCAPCRTSAGVNTDEPRPELPEDMRIYIFHGGIWTDDTLTHALEVTR